MAAAEAAPLLGPSSRAPPLRSGPLRSALLASALTLGTLGLVFLPQYLTSPQQLPAAARDTPLSPRGDSDSVRSEVAALQRLVEEQGQLLRSLEAQHAAALSALHAQVGELRRRQLPVRLSNDSLDPLPNISREDACNEVLRYDEWHLHALDPGNLSFVRVCYVHWPEPPADPKNMHTWEQNALELPPRCLPWTKLWATKWKWIGLGASVMVLLLMAGRMYGVIADNLQRRLARYRVAAARKRLASAPPESRASTAPDAVPNDGFDDISRPMKCCPITCTEPEQMPVCHLWGFVRIVHYLVESDIFRQHCQYDPDTLSAEHMNVYRLIALLSPDLRCCADAREAPDSVSELPTCLAWLGLLFMTVCILLMQIYIPFEMLTESWSQNHLVGVKQVWYYEEKGVAYFMWNSVPLVILGSRVFVSVEAQVREELNQCIYLWQASAKGKLPSGLGRMWPTIGLAWEWMWTSLAFLINFYVAGMMCFYVVHSITTIQKSNGLMQLVFKLIGSIAILEFDDKVMHALPLWHLWYLQHHPLTQNEYSGGTSADKAIDDVETDDDDEPATPAAPAPDRGGFPRADSSGSQGRSPTLQLPPLRVDSGTLRRKPSVTPKHMQDDGEAIWKRVVLLDLPYPAAQKEGLEWRAVRVPPDSVDSQTKSKLGFRYKNAKVTSVAFVRHDLYCTKTHVESAITEQQGRVQTACHEWAFGMGQQCLAKDRPKGLRVGDEIRLIRSRFGPGSKKIEDGWGRPVCAAIKREKSQKEKDKAIACALARLRNNGWPIETAKEMRAEKDKKEREAEKQPGEMCAEKEEEKKPGDMCAEWAVHSDFLVLVKPAKLKLGEHWASTAATLWFADAAHAVLYVISRVLLVGCLFFVFMVYYVDDNGQRLGV
eukprot:TRINITY_DN9728_c0_g1_i4.p1 TRINITY_DN9728_c0_g1~~TRINITY_DN9728_c0_g1_i4.p1  ORF type:complete len:886 (+),score=224.59 TRINITY_DN9728_c0_g1_i4:145-2802(+)